MARLSLLAVAGVGRKVHLLLVPPPVVAPGERTSHGKKNKETKQQATRTKKSESQHRAA